MAFDSQDIKRRFCLSELGESWRRWFEDDWATVPLAGAFREPVDPQMLLCDAPAPVWAGFMLPDTLPILGNGYGDWICVRVTTDGQLGELVHWYHGGGDWIPLGNSLGGACLHDVLDQFRPQSKQMLRSAVESLEGGHQADVRTRFGQADFAGWLSRELTKSHPDAEQNVELLKQLILPGATVGETSSDLLDSRSLYSRGLGLLEASSIAEDAVACDQIEQLLQNSMRGIASRQLADELDIPWSPDFLRFLFDCEPAGDGDQALIRSKVSGASVEKHWEESSSQNWQMAGRVAARVTARRRDLAWAFDIAGWAAERQGDVTGAKGFYIDGLEASAFSDQSVRLCSHWYVPDFPKFAWSRLDGLSREMDGTVKETPIRNNPFWEFRSQGREPTTAGISEFWLASADAEMRSGDPRSAYEAYYRAGWDVGVGRLGDYVRVLSGLVDSAEQAGWEARRQVAQMHLNCLQSR